MINRRSFFRFIASAVSAVALAPEIAFKRSLPLSSAKLIPIWVQTSRIACCYSDDYIKALQSLIAARAVRFP